MEFPYNSMYGYITVHTSIGDSSRVSGFQMHRLEAWTAAAVAHGRGHGGRGSTRFTKLRVGRTGTGPSGATEPGSTHPTRWQATESDGAAD